VFQSDRQAQPTTAHDGLQQLYKNLEIYIVRRDGSELRRLTENDYFDAHPSW
jgi:Tol biopolymer transport system component